MKGWDAIGVGLVVRDITVLMDRFPSADEKLPAKEIVESGGGPVPTALAVMARFGARTAICSTVGRDVVGQFILDGLHGEGIDATAVARIEGFESPTSVIIVEGARRTILEAPKGVDFPLAWDDVERLPLDDCKALLVDARVTNIQTRAAERVRRAGGLVVLDCGHPRPGVSDLVALSDIAIFSHTYPQALLGNDVDLEAFLREIHGQLPEAGPRIAGVTTGERGCVLYTEEHGLQSVPAPSVEALDTTGAGDVFHGAFTHAYLKTGSPRKAATFANTAAAEKCTGLTGRAALPAEEELWRRS